jgi:hypothetical protein
MGTGFVVFSFFFVAFWVGGGLALLSLPFEQPRQRLLLL